jgi:hypothetical protein
MIIDKCPFFGTFLAIVVYNLKKDDNSCLGILKNLYIFKQFVIFDHHFNNR